MILEGFVVDVEPYLYYHPGGVFVLSQRIGFNVDLPFNGSPYSGIQSEEGHNEGHMHSNDARMIAQSLVIGKYVGDVSSLPAVPGKDVVHKTPATDHTTPATDHKTPSDAGHHTTSDTDHKTPADGSHHKPVPKPKPVDEKGYEYKKGPINVKPTDGWDNSSSYKFG